MENNETINANRTKKRPTFLTVICILSFVGIGIGILYYGVYSYFTVEQQTKRAVEMMDMYSSYSDNNMLGDIAYTLSSKVEAQKNLSLVKIFANLLCLVGVLMMWKLKRSGFFIYALAELAIPIMSIVLVGNPLGGTMFAGFGIFAYFILFLFPIGFIVMYAVNLKHMS